MARLARTFRERDSAVAGIYPSTWYDMTREMRRLALRGSLRRHFPAQAAAIEAALRRGGRIVFDPEDEQFYQDYTVDRVLHDPATGRTLAVRRI